MSLGDNSTTMKKFTTKNWKAAPLPFEFHLALDNNHWEDALRVYQLHPYHTAPADTYDLLKQIIYNTRAQLDVVKQRFQAKVKMALNMQKRAPEEVDWATYWDALNAGDSKTISMALCGAKLNGVAVQIGVAETCAALLKSSDKQWYKDLVTHMPFSTVTKSNMLLTCLMRGRWDLSCEMLRYAKLSRSDISSIWPVIEEKFSWKEGLLFMACCSKSAIPYGAVLPFLLKDGCKLQNLSQHLEHLKALSNVDVVAPLIEHAIATSDWDFVQKAVEHLSDIGAMSPAAFRAFQHICRQQSVEIVCKLLKNRKIPIHHLTVELLEEIKV